MTVICTILITVSGRFIRELGDREEAAEYSKRIFLNTVDSNLVV